MSESIEELRAEIERLKTAKFETEARVWALADFLSGLVDALATVENNTGVAAAIRADFIERVRGLYTDPHDAEETVQRRFRRDVFSEL